MEIGVGIIFLLVGFGSAVVGLLLYRNIYLKMRTWKTVAGTVIGYIEDHSRNPCSYVPQVQFTSPDGRLIAFNSSTGSNRRLYGVGAAIKVLCHPDDPAKATIKSFSNLCVLPTFALFFGVVFTSLGLGMIFGKV